MYITIDSISKKYNFIPKGILHLGGHQAEEADDYKNVGCQKVIWIEGNPQLMDGLNNRLSNFPSNKAYNVLISDVDNEKVSLNVTEFSQSSSILEPLITKEEHATKVISTMELTTRRLDNYFREQNIDVSDCDFLNIDLQGYELKALKSLGNLLNNFEYIYTEVNIRHLYKDCPLLKEMDVFMLSKGFLRVQTYMTPWYWGDALYKRTKLTSSQQSKASFQILYRDIFTQVYILAKRSRALLGKIKRTIIK